MKNKQFLVYIYIDDGKKLKEIKKFDTAEEIVNNLSINLKKSVQVFMLNKNNRYEFVADLKKLLPIEMFNSLF